MDGLAAVLSFVAVEQLARRRNDCLFTFVEPYLQRAVLCEIVVGFFRNNSGNLAYFL